MQPVSAGFLRSVAQRDRTRRNFCHQPPSAAPGATRLQADGYRPTQNEWQWALTTKKEVLKFPQSHKPSLGSGISSALPINTANNGCQQHGSWTGAEEPCEGQGGKDELLSASWSVPEELCEILKTTSGGWIKGRYSAAPRIHLR